MKKKSDDKSILVHNSTHRELKILAARDDRSIHKDLADDLIHLGIEAYEKAKKILPSS